MTDITLNIATAPVNWNNDDIPGWRPPERFPDLLDRMVEAGYRATEYDDKIGPEPSIVGEAASSRGIELCGFYQWVDLQNRETFDYELPAIVERLRQLGELGCRHLIVADRIRPERDAIAGRVPADGSSSLQGDGYRLIADQADRLAHVAENYGFATHYHNHVGTYIESPDEVEAFAAAIGGSAIDFCFDTGHFAFAGGNSKAFIERNLDQIGHLHLKDVDDRVLLESKSNGLSFRDALRKLVFAPLGDGAADIGGIIDTLVAHAYPHWVVIEQDTCAGDPTETARANRQFVEQRTTRRVHP